MKALVGAFNQEKALVGAFSVITNLRMELFEALIVSDLVSFMSSTFVLCSSGSVACRQRRVVWSVPKFTRINI